MPTTVIYNATNLQYPKIASWEQEPVYDDSGVNVLYVRHAVDVQFVVSGTDAANFQALMWAIQTNLAEPRKALLIDGGTGSNDHYASLIVGANSLANRVPDIEGGPKPSKVSIVMLAGEISAICRWSVTFVYQHVGVAGGESGFVKTVVSKTFSAQYAIDAEGRQTRTFVGSARIRDLDANNVAITRERLRGLIPPCPRGFRRVGCNITMTPDGLTVRCETIDRELSADWIHGIAEVLDASYTEGMPMVAPGGADINFILRKALSLRLRGCKGFRKEAIMALMVSIIMDKFLFIDVNLDSGGDEDTDVSSFRGGDFPAAVVWSENLIENEIGCVVEAWTIPERYFGDTMSPNPITDHLSPAFLRPLPGDVSVAVHSQADTGGGHDIVTRDLNAADRFIFLSPVQRVIITDLENHSVQGSNPSTSGADDFGLSPTRFVQTTFDRPTPAQMTGTLQQRLANTCGLAKGGYVVDEEHIDIRIDNGRVVMGNTTLGDSGAQGNGTTNTYQHRAPMLIIHQWGRAYRMGKRPNPREPIAYTNEGATPGIVGMSTIKPLPIRSVGPTVQYGVHWRYKRSYNLSSADVSLTAQQLYRLNMEARQLSTRASRVFASEVQDAQSDHFKYNPDPE